MSSNDRVHDTAGHLLRLLRDCRSGDGVWEGYLSSSALSTAVGAFALHQAAPAEHAGLVLRALHWLADRANADGGWGDTPESRSNLSTTLLCWSALSVAEFHDADVRRAAVAASTWIIERVGQPTPDAVSAAVLNHYGNDRTFSAPILTMCALAGRLGSGASAWRHVPQLPFELAALPAQWYRFARLPVVSYALPALIAIGLVRYRLRPVRMPVSALIRERLVSRVLRKLERLQPDSGGFLEAAPLTGFVAMSLCRAGEGEHPVARRAADFLVRTVRDDGSWPIDVNLKTWVTTQAVQAAAEFPGGLPEELLDADSRRHIREWLLRVQLKDTHPYTGAVAGGWAWTDRPGGVPDADDTAGALNALRILTNPRDDAWRQAVGAAQDAVRWLLAIQNRDGGMPTFCRGWGALPFDRSCPDITAHALAAMLGWQDACDATVKARVRRSAAKGIGYLLRSQNPDGSWTPLWFGNEHAVNAENRTYGTAKVVAALRSMRASQGGVRIAPALQRAEQWLVENRNADAGWGGARGTPSTIEETALAVQALAGSEAVPSQIIGQGRHWLEANIGTHAAPHASPIGLYFASLWYWERLYPVIFALGAFGAVQCSQATRGTAIPRDAHE